MIVTVIVIVIVITITVVVIPIAFLRSDVLRHWRPTRALAACVRRGDVSLQRFLCFQEKGLRKWGSRGVSVPRV